jgi:acyl-CoA synthetase (AMP-forming)/AMP-acid ligase II
MTLPYTLPSLARLIADHPAIRSEGQTISYGALDAQAGQIAAALRGRFGISPGGRVAMWMENGAEFFPILHGIWRAGCTAVPVNSKLHPKEFAWIAAHSGARLVFASAKLADSIGADLGVAAPVIVTGRREYAGLFGDDAVRDVGTQPEDDAWLFYTSGTTGRPKGAQLTHRNLMFMAHAYCADIDRLGPQDCFVHAAPLSHGAGLFGLASLATGGQQIIHATFEPEALLHVFAHERRVSMFAAPTMVSRLINHAAAGDRETSGLRCICYGGAPMYVADLVKAMDLFGAKFYQLYGQGESPMTITGLSKAAHAEAYSRGDLDVLGTTGWARTGVAYRIVDEDGRALEDGAVGEIVTRSDCVMKGYLDNPEANARALRQGWLWTGDLGVRDARGLLTLKDRSKDLIISGGSNIYPREIEEVLLMHAGVLECAVVSRAHADWGEVVVAFVVRRPGHPPVAASELDSLCLANIARFKRPKEYRFVDGLPKNNYGKVLKTDLRDRLKAETDSATRRT